MRAFSLILGTCFYLACIPCALAALVGFVSILGVDAVAPAVASVLLFAGAAAAVSCGCIGVLLYRAAAGATDLQYQLCSGAPTLVAGIMLALYSGRLYDFAFSMLVLGVGFALVLVGFIQCFARVESLPSIVKPMA